MINDINQRWPTFCPSPYSFQEIRYDAGRPGQLRFPCCCNIDDLNFASGREPDFATIKKEQLEGKWPDACHSCQDAEKQGILSERIRMLKELTVDQVEQMINRGVSDQFMIIIPFSNRCQLACRSCTANESSTYAKVTNQTERVKFLGKDITEDHGDLIKSRITDILSRSEAMSLHISGGESMIQTGAFKIFDWAIEQGYANRISLVATTALTVSFLDKWDAYRQQFRFTSLNCSIDSVGENYQYVRWPVKFEKVNRHLHEILSIPNLNAAITPVFTLNNIFYLDDYVDYWLNFYQENANCYWRINPISVQARSKYLGVDALPAAYRKHLKELILRVLDHDLFKNYADQTSYFYNWLNGAYNNMDLIEFKDSKWNEYLTHTAYHDLNTGLNFEQFNKRFCDLLSTEDRNKFETIKQTLDSSKPITIYVKVSDS